NPVSPRNRVSGPRLYHYPLNQHAMHRRRRQCRSHKIRGNFTEYAGWITNSPEFNQFHTIKLMISSRDVGLIALQPRASAAVVLGFESQLLPTMNPIAKPHQDPLSKNTTNSRWYADWWLFFSKFLRHGRAIASFVPSSPWLARAL